MSLTPSYLLWGLVGLLLAGLTLGLGGVGPPLTATGVTAGQEPSAPLVSCTGFIDVEGGVASLAPLQAGRVERVLIREGQAVVAGSPLLRLEEEASRLRVEEAHAALAVAEARLKQSRAQVPQHRSRVAQQEAAVEAVLQRLAAARLQFARLEQLASTRLIDVREARVAEAQVKEQEALERAERERLVALQLDSPELSVQAAEAEVTLLTARVAQVRQAAAECELRAPRAGAVLRVLVQPGDLVSGQPGQAAVLLAPDGPRLVRAEVEQEFADRVRIGQAAVVEDDTNPTRRWSGQVLRIAELFTQRRAVLQEPVLRHDVRTVECIVSLEPSPSPPRLGLRVQVTLGGPSR